MSLDAGELMSAAGLLVPAAGGWEHIFMGDDPESSFEDETAQCLSQFASLFDIADKPGEEVGHANWGSEDYVHTIREGEGQAGIVTLNIEQTVVPQTAGVVWDGAVGLCYFLEAHPSLVRGQRVLELGCGTGLPGLVAAVLGASHVLLTEMDDPVCLACAQASVARNADALRQATVSRSGNEPQLTVAALNWGETLPASVTGAGVDVIIAADVLGASSDSMTPDTPTGPFAMLLRTLLEFSRLPSPPKAILIAYKRRLTYREQPFFAKLAQHFKVTVWPVGGNGGTGCATSDGDGERRQLRDIWVVGLEFHGQQKVQSAAGVVAADG
jgi:hypothetical protein